MKIKIKYVVSRKIESKYINRTNMTKSQRVALRMHVSAFLWNRYFQKIVFQLCLVVGSMWISTHQVRFVQSTALTVNKIS